ncbi:MAG: helix-turn-helix transcriptional regulator [Alphaproteobacteria bacterium]|nr:helix-turn-helix transcriptional regulator [Alphaproteobacteria bacterium]
MTKDKENLAPEWVKNLRRLMDEQGLNPRKLSLLAGLNATAVRDMIEGRSRFPRYDTVQALADVLGTTPAMLMSSKKTGAEIQAKGAPFGHNIEILAEIIGRLQETATELGRELNPREFAAMAATIYRRLQDMSDDMSHKSRLSSIKPQVYDLLEYETLRHKRGK